MATIFFWGGEQGTILLFEFLYDGNNIISFVKL